MQDKENKMENVKLNDKAEAVKAGRNGSAAQHVTLLEALSSNEGYSMKTKDALELLYPGDPRPEVDIKNSFASAKTHCWTKADWRVEYLDATRSTIGIVGKRIKGTDTYQPVA